MVKSSNGVILHNRRAVRADEANGKTRKKEVQKTASEILAEVSFPELVTLYEQYDYAEDEATSAKKVIKEEMALRLEQEKVKGKPVNGWSINRVVKTLFTKVTIEAAREFGAIKEAVDTEKLRKLHEKGVKIPGSVESTYIDVRKMQEATAE